MNLPGRLFRCLRVLGLTVLGWMAAGSVAWAQAAQTAPAPGATKGTWVMPYGLVILAVVLGLIVICQPSRRRERSGPEKYEAGESFAHHDDE